MAQHGELPVNRELRGVLTARKSAIEGRPRGGESKEFTFTLGERYGVLFAKIVGLLEDRSLRHLRLSDQTIYFKASKGASQQHFVLLRDENFVELLNQRLRKVSTREKEAWGDDIFGNLQFDFFIYCRLRVESQPSIHRATPARIRAATAAVQQFQRESGQTFGPIALNHAITTHARQPDGTEFTMPSDNTARQAMALDASVSESRESRASEDTARVATVRMEINGSWTDFRVDVASLRAALGLPAHDIYTAGIYHGFEPVAAPEVDLEDTDHMDDMQVDIV